MGVRGGDGRSGGKGSEEERVGLECRRRLRGSEKARGGLVGGEGLGGFSGGEFMEYREGLGVLGG